jgi:hypothetical protein
MKRNRPITAALTGLFVVGLLSWPSASHVLAATATTFSGRAVVLEGQVEGASIGPLVDTGPVAPEGGSLHAHLLSYPDGGPDPTNGALKAEVLHAAVTAHGDRSRAEATVANLQVSAAGQTLGASFLSARAMAVCRKGTATVSGSSEIATLTVNDKTVVVDGTMNQTVTLPTIGEIIINEQVFSASAGNGEVTVNALHLKLTNPITGAKTDLVIASAHADIACGQNGGCDSQDFVTGGGWITASSGAKGNFAVAGGKVDWGHLLYIDHGGGPRVKGTAVTMYSGTDNTRKIVGNAEINGASVTYTVDVTDGGEPGRGTDTFSISLSNGYKAGGYLGGGNIQLHCK